MGVDFVGMCTCGAAHSDSGVEWQIVVWSDWCEVADTGGPLPPAPRLHSTHVCPHPRQEDDGHGA